MKYKILLIDDEFDEIRTILYGLDSRNFEIKHVENPYEAIDALILDEYDAIVTDNDMKYFVDDTEFTGLYLLKFLEGIIDDEVLEKAVFDHFKSYNEYDRFVSDVPELRAMYSSSIDRERENTEGLGDVYFTKKNRKSDIVEFLKENLSVESNDDDDFDLSKLKY